jgi:hypothetical protein
LQDRQPKFLSQGLADLTGQIVCTMSDLVSASDLGIVYKCQWKRLTGSVKVWTSLGLTICLLIIVLQVAVKVIKVDMPDLALVVRICQGFFFVYHLI